MIEQELLEALNKPRQTLTMLLELALKDIGKGLQCLSVGLVFTVLLLLVILMYLVVWSYKTTLTCSRILF